MSFTIFLTQEALQEEAEAYLFYERELTGLGERFLEAVEATLKRSQKTLLTILFQMKLERSGMLA